MVDPILTTLCSICHIVTPKYTCPRCQIRTCSLACIRKHKSWSECSGERDPTVYVPKKKLRTAAGIDHDYNFLHKIERAVERNEKTLVEEKNIVAAGELKGARDGPGVEWKWKFGKDGRRRKVPVMKRGFRRPEGGRAPMDRALGTALRRDNVEVVRVSKGMQRERDNKTNWSRRSGRVNWQVEWLSMEEGHKRLLGKVMEDTPLGKAYALNLEEEMMAGKSKAERKSRYVKDIEFVQNEAQGISGTWTTGGRPVQDPITTMWSVTGGTLGTWPSERNKVEKSEYRFFLARPSQRADQPIVVTKVAATQTLKEILANTKVLEFPCIYILKGDSKDAIPSGFVLGSKERASTNPNGHPQGNGSTLGMKRRREDDDEGSVEEAEGEEEESELDEDDVTSSEGSSSDEDEDEDEEEDGELIED